MTDDAPTSRARRFFDRERALSVSTWLLGHAAMRDLKLPYRPGWYGLTRVAANLVITHGVGRLPASRQFLLHRAERQANAQFSRWKIANSH
jgi:hypothetical protein